MQLYALNQKGEPLNAQQAQKGLNYFCLECQSRVRLRAGLHRQRHFYHVQPNRMCRLHRKGMIHLQLQLHLYACLSKGDCQLEYHFSTINRIADVAWLSKKIVFEIQYSFITAEEIQRRNRDYRTAGWEVIWILHDHLYNQVRLKAAEYVLRDHPHYFTNMDSQGQGMIYDQFDLIDHGLRKHKMKPLSLNLTEIKSFENFAITHSSLRLVSQRIRKWPFFCLGDLCYLSQQEESSFYLQNAQKKEELFYEELRRQLKQKKILNFKRLLYKAFIYPYRLLFRIWLERACR